MSKKTFPVYRQLEQMDCGPTCLRMIAKYYGRHYSLETLRGYSFITREGVSLMGISEAALRIGLRTQGTRLAFDQLNEEVPLPCILHWNQNHFVVLPPQDLKRNIRNNKILVVDPAHGQIKVSNDTFLKAWATTSDKSGIALLMEPAPSFYASEDEKTGQHGLGFLFRYLRPYRRFIVQLILGLLAGSILSLIAPFLTQGLVDYGINQQNVNFVYLILAAQLSLFLGNTAIEIIRGWIILHVSTRVNISIISDFLVKLMKLPIRFFDTRVAGDINQRILDQSKIEQFLSVTTLNTLFSLVTLVVFSIVLSIYGLSIFLIFILGSALSVGWIVAFLKKRRELDYARFQRMTDNQNSLFEIIMGLQEIKLTGSETTHRWKWEHIQSRLFRIRIRGLALAQYQSIGSSVFTQLKNILVTFVAAREVMRGNMTLGMMLSVSYIIGQMNSPVEQLLSFLLIAQDARISVDRLSEIHEREDEEKDGQLMPDFDLRGLTLKDVSFQYGGPDSPMVLDGINLTIPCGKTTAIVGASGSGKTTLMKVLLKYYEPVRGQVCLGSTDINLISPKWWWQQCGVVQSDGYVFSNTIERNICVQEPTDNNKLLSAIRISNIEPFINSLPLGVLTKIGNIGKGISSGQKQRILIARAIYKEPRFLFLDEATSTLDANNERIIIENLDNFFVGRTVVVIAHRLSTVKHADQIVVMENGRIVETGTHQALTNLKGKYYELVKNQLELGT